MWNTSLRNLFKGTLLTALLMACGATLASNPGLYHVVDGVAFYLGVLPAEMVRGHHPKDHPEGEMHDGVPARGDYHHVVIALFDSDSGERITDAQIKAKVEEPGHLIARREEREALAEFGEKYARYAATTSAFIPPHRDRRGMGQMIPVEASARRNKAQEADGRRHE